MTYRVFTFGESMGLLIGDEINSLEQLGQARISSAGSEGNVAIGLSRLGISATWLSRIGRDGFGKRIVNDLKSQGVQVIARNDTAAPTGVLFKTYPRAGETVVDYFRKGSAASNLDQSDIDSVKFEEYDLVHVTGITPALSQSCYVTWLEVAKRAKKSGCLLSFDLNYRSKLWTEEQAREAFSNMTGKADILIAGVEESQILLDDKKDYDVLSISEKIHQLGPKVVVIKQGALGASAFDGHNYFYCEPIKVQAVDTVGAGDAFTSAFIAYYLESSDVEHALKKAVVSGALVCTHPGDWQGLPDADELENFMQFSDVKR